MKFENPANRGEGEREEGSKIVRTTSYQNANCRGGCKEPLNTELGNPRHAQVQPVAYFHLNISAVFFVSKSKDPGENRTCDPRNHEHSATEKLFKNVFPDGDLVNIHLDFFFFFLRMLKPPLIKIIKAPLQVINIYDESAELTKTSQ
jgi:hypothetical protein